MSPRTLITDENAQDLSFVAESELNAFFGTVVITGTETSSEVVQTFDQYFPGRGLITVGSGILVTTGTNFIQISSTSGSSLTIPEHETLDTLVHSLAESVAGEIVKNPQGLVSQVNYRIAPVSGTLVRSTAVTRNSQNQVTAIIERQHDSSGTIVQILTTTLNRIDGKITSVTIVET